MAVQTQFQVRRGLAATWTSTNPTLAAGEFGLETDTGQFKIGNGSTVWTSLGYATITATGSVAVTNKDLTSNTNTFPTSLVTLTSSQTLTNKTLTAPVITYTINAQTGTSYTPILSDAASLITMNNASGNSFAIPTNGNVSYPIGSSLTLIQIGAGQTTIQAVTPGTTTIASTGATSASPKLRAQYSMATAIKVATDLWYVTGDII